MAHLQMLKHKRQKCWEQDVITCSMYKEHGNYPKAHLYLNEDNVTEKDLLEVRLNLLTETDRESCLREESDLK